jgi:hypothetical protein
MVGERESRNLDVLAGWYCSISQVLTIGWSKTLGAHHGATPALGVYYVTTKVRVQYYRILVIREYF